MADLDQLATVAHADRASRAAIAATNFPLTRCKLRQHLKRGLRSRRSECNHARRNADDDRRIDSYVRAGTAPLEGSAATDDDWEDVIAARFHLLINSGEEDGVTENPVSVPFAGGTFTAGDRRIYQEFTATVGVRNRLP